MASTATAPRPIRRALISAWDKTGLADFARSLSAQGVEIVCSGGTAKHLAAEGIAVSSLSEVTGFENLLGGRVKTLHPAVHAAILARPGADEEELAESGLQAIDLVVVDLYPFAAAVADAASSEQDIVEKIDIGGVALLRAAAKNHERVCVIADAASRALFVQAWSRDGGTDLPLRRRLAAMAIAHTSGYDGLIADWLAQAGTTEDTTEDAAQQMPESMTLRLRRTRALRYGENPHQQAALYLHQGGNDAGVYDAEQLQGKELSYNNLQDAQAAWDCCGQFDRPACVVVKHANPCAAAMADSLVQAWQLALQADGTSPFGGIVAFNRILDGETASALREFGFLEVVLAPGFDDAAREVFAKRKALRLLQPHDRKVEGVRWQWAGLGDALLVQQLDNAVLQQDDLRVVTRLAPNEAQMADLLFAWRIGRYVKSNAVVYAADGAVKAVGAGQMSRVFSAQIAGLKAAQESVNLWGTVLASDAFFPFRDGIDVLAGQGVVAVIQPGGSVRDEEIVQAADEYNLAMVFTGMRHFRH